MKSKILMSVLLVIVFGFGWYGSSFVRLQNIDSTSAFSLGSLFKFNNTISSKSNNPENLTKIDLRLAQETYDVLVKNNASRISLSDILTPQEESFENADMIWVHCFSRGNDPDKYGGGWNDAGSGWIDETEWHSAPGGHYQVWLGSYGFVCFDWGETPAEY